MRPLNVSTGARRDSAVRSGAVKVGMLGALATATIAVPLASATAGGLDASAPLADAVEGVEAISAPQTVEPTEAPAVEVPEVTAALVRDTDDVASRSSERTSTTASDDAATDTATESLAADDSSSTLAVAIADPELVTLYSESAGNASGYIKPVDAPITSGYGVRVHPVLGYVKGHEGTDFGAACGTPVHAAQAGTVVAVERTSASGNRVKIDHGDGVTTGYYHLQSFNTTVGATVAQGDVIGYVGSTGQSTGCHLHFAKMDASGAYSDPMSLFE